jgi:hypothetical protein
MSTTVITDSGEFNFPFTGLDMTTAINTLPSLWGALRARMFPAEALATSYVRIDISSDVIYALPVGKSIARNGSAEGRIIEVPSIIHYDNLTANDIKNMLAMASRSGDKALETMANQLNKKLGLFKTKFELTHEIMCTSALKGIVTDGAGYEIINLFTAFGVTKKQVFFDLADATTDIKGHCRRVRDLIVKDLSDETMTIIEAEVSPDFFDALTQHAKVEKFYQNSEHFRALANVGQQREGNYRYREFLHENILFKENPAIVPFKSGAAPLIAAGKGHAYPAGTRDSHKTFISPPDDINVLNGGAANPDDAIHITEKLLDHGEGIELKGQMNALPLWNRPKLLIELDQADGVSTAV